MQRSRLLTSSVDSKSFNTQSVCTLYFVLCLCSFAHRCRLWKSNELSTLTTTKHKDQSTKTLFIMKRCPTCNRTFDEEWLAFCTDDGGTLIETTSAPLSNEPPPTVFIPPAVNTDPGAPKPFDLPGSYNPPQPVTPAWQPPPPPPMRQGTGQKQGLAVAALILGICQHNHRLVLQHWFAFSPGRSRTGDYLSGSDQERSGHQHGKTLVHYRNRLEWLLYCGVVPDFHALRNGDLYGKPEPIVRQ